MSGVSPFLGFPIDLDAGDLPVGTVLTRTYRGRVYTVSIEPGLRLLAGNRSRGWWRYRWDGRLWKTLSAIAYEITGDRYMSGNRFFKLRHRRGKCRKRLTRRLH